MHHPFGSLVRFTISVILLCSFAFSAFSEQDDVEEESYLTELRKEAINNSKKSEPETIKNEEPELLDEKDKKELMQTSSEEVAKIKKFKPVITKPE